ncbi:hypothetical protein CCH79_00018342 [Gambusia affinis]|uniref:Uncharacterized protein n=1 Tax=Gambusia affinis TaxID=33528 RepID=A0A315V861_GAMAF|nr:hypothetical protein CCH79_00018342 [Gambusia affinis]
MTEDTDGYHRKEPKRFGRKQDVLPEEEEEKNQSWEREEISQRGKEEAKEERWRPENKEALGGEDKEREEVEKRTKGERKRWDQLPELNPSPRTTKQANRASRAASSMTESRTSSWVHRPRMSTPPFLKPTWDTERRLYLGNTWRTPGERQSNLRRRFRAIISEWDTKISDTNLSHLNSRSLPLDFFCSPTDRGRDKLLTEQKPTECSVWPFWAGKSLLQVSFQVLNRPCPLVVTSPLCSRWSSFDFSAPAADFCVSLKQQNHVDLSRLQETMELKAWRCSRPPATTLCWWLWPPAERPPTEGPPAELPPCEAPVRPDRTSTGSSQDPPEAWLLFVCVVCSLTSTLSGDAAASAGVSEPSSSSSVARL